jgi:hypothetical protein
MTVRFRKLVPKTIYFDLAKDPAISKIEIQPCRNKKLRNPHIIDCQIYVTVGKQYLLRLGRQSIELLKKIQNTEANCLAKCAAIPTYHSISYKSYISLYNFNKDNALNLEFGKKYPKILKDWEEKTFLDPSLKWE